MRITMMLVILLASFTLSATQCLSAPPSKVGLSDLPANNKLTRSQEASLNRLFKDLSGSWVGKSDGFYCIGEELTNARKVAKSHRLEMDFSNDDSMVLRAKTNAQEHDEFTQRIQTLTLYANQGYLRFGQNNEAGDIWIEALSSTHVSVWSVSRAGTVYHLINRVLKRSPSAFTLTMTTYSNNRLTSHYVARMSN